MAAWRLRDESGLEPVAAGAVASPAAVEAVQARAVAMPRACEPRPGTVLAVMALPAGAVAGAVRAPHGAPRSPTLAKPEDVASVPGTAALDG